MKHIFPMDSQEGKTWKDWGGKGGTDMGDKEKIVTDIIWLLCTWGCGSLFAGIGWFAKTLSEPMWFWSGSTVPADTVKDIPAYNREMARMWYRMSLPMWITGITFMWLPALSAIAMGIAVVMGIPIMIRRYHRIRKKYWKEN